MIDFRSDTITRPTPEMRNAIANADVGDDVFGDDPTVNLLQEMTAEILGKEAALYVPSGSMANQLGLRCLTRPGDEVILHEDSHHYFYEAGGGFVLSGAVPRLLKGERGMFTVDDVRNALRPIDDHFPQTKLIWIENTTNRGGGAVWDIQEIEKIKQFADEKGFRMHLDGARLWNASTASGIPEKEYAKYFDTVNVCFSKGLGAPVGSALVSDKQTITQAKRYRKLFGGAMRQAGIIAAGAIFALDNHRDRLKDDHDNAKKLAEGIAQLPGISLNLNHVETNILIFHVSAMPAKDFATKLYDEGVWMLAVGPDMIRAVTNYHISPGDIEKAISVFRKLLS
jgi:threonine aldolase